MGPPSDFTQEMADEICGLLIDGLSLRQICEREGFPNRRTVMRWAVSSADFANQLSLARDLQADLMDDMILEEAQNCTSETAKAARVKISAYQWRASKLAVKYADRHRQNEGETGERTIVYNSPSADVD